MRQKVKDALLPGQLGPDFLTQELGTYPALPATRDTRRQAPETAMKNNDLTIFDLLTTTTTTRKRKRRSGAIYVLRAIR